MATIDMQTIRYLNILDTISHVKTTRCFCYNNQLFFAVPKDKMSKAIGISANNVRQIQSKIGKRVKIVTEPNTLNEIKNFVADVISPVHVRNIEINEGAVVINAGSNQNRAVLIGREKRRYNELKKITGDYFNLDLKIV